jgi:hypothetical protein
MVPLAVRVTPRTFKSSTAMTSNRRARSVEVLSTQSLRRSLSRARSRAMVDPRNLPTTTDTTRRPKRRVAPRFVPALKDGISTL